MKSNIEMKMELMERRQAVHANKIQALMLMIIAMQIPEKEKNRKILKAVRVSTALLWILTCVEDLVLIIRNSKLNKSEKRKAKQCQAEKIQKLTLSLESLLGEKTTEPTLWQKAKSYISGIFNKKTFFELNDFRLVSEQGYPKNQAICVYIWKDKNEQLFWQTGIYNQKLKQFSVCYGTVRYAINEDKVTAWKKMNADAVALEITDRRN